MNKLVWNKPMVTKVPVKQVTRGGSGPNIEPLYGNQT